MTTIDEHAAAELELYIDNTASIYQRVTLRTFKTLMRLRRDGIYTSARVLPIFEQIACIGAQLYAKEHGERGAKWDTMFDKPTRVEVATRMRDAFEAEAELGNYDDL